ncbi:MAG: exo-alpha-sialidase [Clostridiales bacterium]|nr:exo-alpha-sialidase [Clostridiales bacterium]
MKITLGKERVIVRGIKPEEKAWGPYQFPRPYHLGDRIMVSVHVEDDNLKTYGDTCRWFESWDNGKSWKERDSSVAKTCGLKLPNGDRLYLPPISGTKLEGYSLTDVLFNTPDYDYTKQAVGKQLPLPDGYQTWPGGFMMYAFKAERLPEELAKKEWIGYRIPAGETEPVMERISLDWPYLTHIVYKDTDGTLTLKGHFPRGNLKLGPDNALWVTAFSGEGHLNPKNGQYSPYYSAELFRSDDNGHTFTQWAHMEYPADGDEYPYKSGGFSDSDIEFMPDGSIVWFMRSVWGPTMGCEWSPMYMSRSEDGGKTWSKPKPFAPTGILPRLCKLSCGAILLCYARPGMFIQGTLDGVEWTEPVVAMTPEDRSHLLNEPVEVPTFHQWAGACNNPELIPIEDNKALFVYSDSYYPDEDGTRRKTILCRPVTVEL